MPIERPETPVVRHPEYVYMDYARHLSGRLRRSITGPMYHGRSLREALEGCTAAEAVEKPLRTLPCIWDIVLHVAARAERAILHMDGMVLEDPIPGADWPRMPIPCTVEAWEASQRRMHDAYKALAVRVCQVVSTGFVKVAESSGCNVATMADGIVEHGAYHAAQIVLIRKEVESRRIIRNAALTDRIW